MSYPLVASLTIDSTGTGTATFPAPPSGSELEGTMAIPMANAGATYVVDVGGLPYTSGQGSSPCGPVVAKANQQVTVAAANMLPGSYQVAWTVNQVSLGSADSYPAPVAQTPAIPQQPLGVIAGSAGTVTETIQVPGSTRSLIFVTPKPASGATFSVVGATTGYNYTGGTVAIGGAQVVDFLGAAYDTAVTVTVTGLGVGNSSWVSADQLIENQLVFASAGGIASRLLRPDGRAYPEGDAAASINGAGTIIPAPAAGLHVLVQTLSLALVAGAAEATAQLNVTKGGVAVGVFTVAAAASSEGNGVWVPPAGFLCDAATAVTVSDGGTVASVNANATYDVVS